jgi:putative transcriptional regulator
MSKQMAGFHRDEKSQTGDPSRLTCHCALATPQSCLHLRSVQDKNTMMDLTGQLLIAMPGMPDPRFEHSVIYVCSHSDEGAMGLIINKPSADVTFGNLLDQLSIDSTKGVADISVHFGGPVELGRGFVLHSPDFRSDMATLKVNDAFAMTGTLDVLENIASGTGPIKRLIALGYSGWGPGQLESEIAANGWLTCAATMGLVFDTKDDDKWQAALGSLGISPLALSAEGGRA